MDKEAGGSSLSSVPPPPPPPPIIPPDVTPEILKTPIMTRPVFRNSRKRISLRTNHFNVSIGNPDGVFYQYKVSISSEDDGSSFESKGIGRFFFDKLYQTCSSEPDGMKFAYDGEKSLYTLGPLPQNKLEFTVVLEESFSKCSGSPSHSEPSSKKSKQSQTFKVKLSYAAKIPLKSISLALQGAVTENVQDALRVLDIILRQEAANRGCLLVRPSFFPCGDPRDLDDVGGGVPEFHSRFNPTRGGLSLNLDGSTKTMILTPGCVIKFLVSNQNVQDERDIDWGKAKRMLKNMRVQTRHTKMEFKIIGLSEKPCNQQTFSLKVKSGDDGEEIEITVSEYFKKYRSIELDRSACMPCLNVGKLRRPNYLPLELCSLVSLERYTEGLSSMQRACLVVKSRQEPPEKMKVLTDAVRNYKDNPLLIASGISIQKQLAWAHGRVLEAPKLKFGNGEDCEPHDGRWNFRNKQLYKPVKVEWWAVVNFSDRCDTIRFYKELIKCGRKMGVIIAIPHIIIDEQPKYRKSSPWVRVEKMFSRIVDMFSDPPEFLLCVLPEPKNSDIYGPWKKRCLWDEAIPNQCISPPPSKAYYNYLRNVLLKINIKLGGINSLLEKEHLLKVRAIEDTHVTMIMGMHVSHGPPGVPSIAAVVGSRSSPLMSRYRAAARIQSSKVEMIESLFELMPDGTDGGMMRELLVKFYQTSSYARKPDQIVVFRDGLSESQVNRGVLEKELEQMKQACKHLGMVDLPKFAVIVAQKTHHSKLFQAEGLKNVPPGTVVDTKVGSWRKFDFYMCAHAGMTGTSRPTHYHVLIDEIGYTRCDLQSLIHSLSYVYQSSTSAISIVAPLRYAHLVAQQIGKVEFSETSSGRVSLAASGELSRFFRGRPSAPMFFV